MKTRLVILFIMLPLFVAITGCNKSTSDSKSMKPRETAGELLTADKTISLLVTIGGPAIEIAKDMIATGDGGYVLAGYTSSKGAGAADCYLVKITGSGDTIWDKTFGGKNNDALYSVATTDEGGYVAAGKIEVGEEKNRNLYVVKTDSNGSLIWEKNFGSEKEEEANCIIKTGDGGYMVCGLTNSKGAGSGDAWVIKLSKSGDLEWDKTYGTKAADFANAIVQTKDGGYVFAGLGGEKADMYVARIDAKGTLIWEKFIGTPYYDVGSSLAQTDDGSLVVSGITQEKPNTKVDAYIVKLSPGGDIIWDKAVRTDSFSSAINIKRTGDRGFITCGTIVANQEKGGSGSVYFIKLSEAGAVQWTKTIGGKDVEYGNVVVPDADGKYSFAGYIGYKDPAKAGNFDILFGRFSGQ